MMQLGLSERGHLTTRGLSTDAFGGAEAASDYFSSDKHYASLARRIIAALRSGGGWVLITGEPPADPQALSEALGNVAGVHYEAIIISCGPDLTREDLEGAVPVVAAARATADTPVRPESSETDPPLFLFADFGQLSDKQIGEIYNVTPDCGQIPAAGILLASLDFVVRLERPELHFLKEHLNAHFGVQEVGDDEAITFLHHQLIVRRDRETETRGFRRGILIGLAAAGGVLAAGVGLFIILNPPAEQVRLTPESTGQRRPISEEVSLVVPPAAEVADSVSMQTAPKTETRSSPTTTPPPPVSSTVVESPASVEPSVVANLPADLHSAVSTGERRPISEEQSTVQPPGTRSSSSTTIPPPPLSTSVPENLPAGVPSSAVHSPAGLQYSDAEIAILMRRGDAFLTSGDITSARLFFERAAEAGSGPAALQLGATFDPVMLGRVGGRIGLADRAQALLWYRRARDLGIVEAEQEIKRIETSSLGAGQSAPLK
jgi:hypothetical protein